eukprot:m.290493 g.290493  ORF g.290493 m.290493 type:complete len:64 (+) comp211706_c0_seq1:86-277(+)
MHTHHTGEKDENKEEGEESEDGDLPTLNTQQSKIQLHKFVESLGQTLDPIHSCNLKSDLILEI